MEVIQYFLTIQKGFITALPLYLSFVAMRPPFMKTTSSKSLLSMLVQQRASKEYPQGESIDTHLHINTKLKSVIEKPGLLS